MNHKDRFALNYILATAVKRKDLDFLSTDPGAYDYLTATASDPAFSLETERDRLMHWEEITRKLRSALEPGSAQVLLAFLHQIKGLPKLADGDCAKFLDQLTQRRIVRDNTS
jgi:hypothetical protein